VRRDRAREALYGPAVTEVEDDGQEQHDPGTVGGGLAQPDQHAHRIARSDRPTVRPRSRHVNQPRPSEYRPRLPSGTAHSYLDGTDVIDKGETTNIGCHVTALACTYDFYGAGTYPYYVETDQRYDDDFTFTSSGNPNAY
jgi:hypothetical protein